MIHIHHFVLNPFQVNTYLVFDESREAVIIDPGCYREDEEDEIMQFILDKGLRLVDCLNTHAHVDHVLGDGFIFKSFGLKTKLHRDGSGLLRNVAGYGQIFGMEVADFVTPTIFVDEGDRIVFGKSELELLYTPGHADGSLCFLSREQKFVISGDVLFFESIGRTDLPTGNHNKLMGSLHGKLLILPDDYVVYPGHGHETTIGHEKAFNPFLA